MSGDVATTDGFAYGALHVGDSPDVWFIGDNSWSRSAFGYHYLGSDPAIWRVAPALFSSDTSGMESYLRETFSERPFIVDYASFYTDELDFNTLMAADRVGAVAGVLLFDHAASVRIWQMAEQVVRVCRGLKYLSMRQVHAHAAPFTLPSVETLETQIDVDEHPVTDIVQWITDRLGATHTLRLTLMQLRDFTHYADHSIYDFSSQFRVLAERGLRKLEVCPSTEFFNDPDNTPFMHSAYRNLFRSLHVFLWRSGKDWNFTFHWFVVDGIEAPDESPMARLENLPLIWQSIRGRALCLAGRAVLAGTAELGWLLVSMPEWAIKRLVAAM